MASKKKKDKILVKLGNPDSKYIYFYKRKKTGDKLTLNKYCPTNRKVMVFKETGKA